MLLRVGLETVWQMDRGGRSQRQRSLPSILRRLGRRYMPEICWYLAKRTPYLDVNQGGTADNVCSIRP